MACAMKVAEKSKQGVVVTIFSDSADKYLSERFWEESVEASE
jgi:cysteine synthase